MSERELRSAAVFSRVVKGGWTLLEAAERMEVSYRQAKRLWKRYRAEGAAGLVHGNAGRVSNRAKPRSLRCQVLRLIRKKYGGEPGQRFGPTLGVGISFWAQPIGDPIWLAAGMVILVGAVTTNAAAFRRLRQSSDISKPKGGVRLAVLAGILIGCFPPFVARAISGSAALDSYTVSFYFMVGAMLATFLVVPILLVHPLFGDKGSLKGYLQGSLTWGVLGLIAGGIWCFGTVVNFLSARLVGMAISWGVGSSASMVAALWGIFLWKEFANSARSAKILIAVSLAC
jgi:transposase